MDSSLNLTQIDAENGNSTPEILNVPPLPPISTRSSEDWLCSICMDYLIDAVQTSCSHKFCRFCIDRWMSFNPSRRCPICRSALGPICSIPELDASINSFLQNNLTQEELRQRNVLQDQRARAAATRERNHPDSDNYFFVNSWLSDSVESHLVSNALRSSLEAAQQELQHRNTRLLGSSNSTTNSLFQETDNPWATQSTSSIINHLRQSIERLHEFGHRYPFHGIHHDSASSDQLDSDYPSQPDIPVRIPALESAILFSEEGDETLTRLTAQNNNHRPPIPGRMYSQRLRHQSQRRTMIEDDLVNEYNYHIRRAESAYSRIQEAQRDFDFHNSELIILECELATNQAQQLSGYEEADLRDESIPDLHIRGSSRRNRLNGRRGTHVTRTSSGRSNDDDTDSNVDLFRRLRRTGSRWGTGLNLSENHRPFRQYSQQREAMQNNNSRPRIRSTGLRGESRAHSLNRNTPSGSVRRRPSQNLRPTREEVHLPQPSNNQISGNVPQMCQMFQNILTSNGLSPLRTWSESISRPRNLRPERRTHTPPMEDGQQSRRRNVQFQSHSDEETPERQYTLPSLATTPTESTGGNNMSEALVQRLDQPNNLLNNGIRNNNPGQVLAFSTTLQNEDIQIQREYYNGGNNNNTNEIPISTDPIQLDSNLNSNP